MTTDYTEGDPPVPEGTIVEFTGAVGTFLCRITACYDPYSHPSRNGRGSGWVIAPGYTRVKYPDGFAYELAPVERQVSADGRSATLSVSQVARTSFRVIEPPREGTT